MQDEKQKSQSLNHDPATPPIHGWDPFKGTNDTQPPSSPQSPMTESSQPVRPSQTEIVSSSNGSYTYKRSHKKRNIWISILVLAILALAGAAAYTLLYYLPNRPEIVLQKAVESYINDKANYSIAGKLDQSGSNDPDFTYSMKTYATGQAETDLSVSTFLQAPQIKTIKTDDKLFINLSGFEDFKTLSKHYRNAGQPGIQEAIAAFTEASGLAGNQDKWLQVDNYITEQPLAPKQDGRIAGIPGANLKTIGAVETREGKSVRRYEVTLDSQAFTLMMAHIDANTGAPILSGITSNAELTGEQLTLNLWVDLSTKKIEQITYSGHPFKNATFDINIKSGKEGSLTALKAELLTSALNYGIVNNVVFNPGLQLGGTDNDKHRIADLKGIKAALEMYKARHGLYPERYDMSVNQERFIISQMPGVDLNIFKDPSNTLMGRSGSQYAYVPESESGDQNCGKFSQPCRKFFIATTLDNGQKYQLNSY